MTVEGSDAPASLYHMYSPTKLTADTASVQPELDIVITLSDPTVAIRRFPSVGGDVKTALRLVTLTAE